MKHNHLVAASSAALLALGGNFMPADACTRVLYKGTDSLYVVGRSLDWKTPIPTNIYVYPRGMEKKGSDKPNALTWTSKYGAVYAVSYDAGVTEGMNEARLSVNGLFCKNAIYEKNENTDKPAMSMAMFVAWLLDNHATAPEVAKTLRERNFHISGSTFDGGTVSALHWGITDAEGRTTIVEFVGGDIEVYEGDDIRVLTNDPNWPQMNAINDYWKGIGGVNMLPGTVKSPDRFVRADFFARHVKAVGDTDLGVSICRSVLVNACVPYTYLIEGEPNVSSTQWRSYSDLRDRRYYWDDVTALGIYYIDLNKCDLRPGAPVLKLTTADCKQLAGEANKHLKKVPPFTPQY